MTDFNIKGKWEPVFDLKNVAAHASLLPNGTILYWGRRSNPKDEVNHDSLNERFTRPFILKFTTAPSGEIKPDVKPQSDPASEPRDTKNRTVNLFCSGHTLLADGRVFVVGGHLADNAGIKQACIYDPSNNTWTAQDPMNDGRCVSTLSGSYVRDNGVTVLNNVNPQIWLDSDNGWVSAPPTANAIQALYPRLHLDPKGRIFLAGPTQSTQFLDTNVKSSQWAWTTDGPNRKIGWRGEGSSVQYDSGKILYTGGGGGDDNDPNWLPAPETEMIDLNITPKPQWTPASSMQFGRRQHNATVLPDGTVLVTGGTKGPGFNNLDPGNPVHEAELWDPSSNKWTTMNKEDSDRCYHSVAILLPDGHVLSAGGGEYQPDKIGKVVNTGPNGKPNPAKDSIMNAQLFKPPYFFKTPRPTIVKAPSVISYDKDFTITVGAGDVIKKASWIRLASVTHSCNMNQSLIFLDCKQASGSPNVTVTAPSNPVLAPTGPANARIAPPGHYMLFALNDKNIPSIASIIQIKQDDSSAQPKPTQRFARRAAAAAEQNVEVHLPTLNENIISEQSRPAVAVGLTPICPYGLGGCWGGAFEALQKINDIDVVRPVPSHADSIGYVYLGKDVLPDIDVWRSEFQKTANGSYVVRGIEMTLSGPVTKKNVGSGERLTLTSSSGPEVTLEPLQEGNKIQWDRAEMAPKPMTNAEAGAYSALAAAVEGDSKGSNFQVTGPLQKLGDDSFSIQVREFEAQSTGTS
ncbi:copper radical oxidase [Lophiostoma macrostomum CBS 122681]|uniref:Copper radical oxidase n=1 Tax=Lophiostoma macrostomum CBS 122681 TaxID=1314788 RepID=A0A6A6SII2_9PLEO|nr:copper radical oxidase [Lophiostoma macrostomum CBS 122681]